MSDPENVSRRTTLLGLGATGVAAIGAGAAPAPAQPAGSASPRHARVSPAETRALVRQRVDATPFVDTHEHLLEETTRLRGTGPEIRCDDWAFLLAHYFDSDLLAAGMPQEDHGQLFSPRVDPLEKWRLLEPWWPHARHTGYGRAVAIALQELYGVETLSASTVARVQEGYEALRKPGFYEKVLRGHANVSSAQVNCLEGVPFLRSAQPTLLMQDIFLNGIDYADVPAEVVEASFRKRVEGEKLPPPETKALEDHLFWYGVRRATASRLPVKLHTGYYAQWAGKKDRMPLSRVGQNPAAAADLCVVSPETRFVFMHIGYPYYEDLIALAELVDEGWLSLDDALALVEPLLNGNARALFDVDAKARKLASAPWLR